MNDIFMPTVDKLYLLVALIIVAQVVVMVGGSDE